MQSPEPPASPEDGSAQVQKETSASETATAADTLDAFGLPVMSAENQQIYDQYFRPFESAISIFVWSFDEDHVEHFLPARAYSCLVRPQEAANVAQEEVEALLTRYFPMSAAAMREQESIHEYDEETQTYSVLPMKDDYTQNIRGAVVSSTRDGERLTVNCVWRDSVYPENPESFQPLAKTTTVIRLLSETEWLYESNQAVRAQ